MLTQFSFTTSESGLDHYHQKMKIRVASRISEQHKIHGILEILEDDGKIHSQQPKRQILKVFQKGSCNTFHGKT